MGSVHFVCAPPGTGKTFYCLELIKRFRQAGKRVSGILSEYRERGSEREAIYARDLSTGNTQILAWPRTTDRPTSDIYTPRWNFSPATVDWGNEVIRSAVPTEVLILDELGILEFEKNQGWTEGLKVIEGGKFESAFVTLRPALADLARQRWSEARWIL